MEVYEIRPTRFNLAKFSKFIRETAAIFPHLHQKNAATQLHI